MGGLHPTKYTTKNKDFQDLVILPVNRNLIKLRLIHILIPHLGKPIPVRQILGGSLYNILKHLLMSLVVEGVGCKFQHHRILSR